MGSRVREIVGISFGKEYYKMIVNAGYRGKVGAAAPKFTYTGQYNQRDDGVIELLTSGTITFLSPAVIDIFCVGGGGQGGSMIQTPGTIFGQGGGAGGYTTTLKKATVNGSYDISIGAGGRLYSGSAGGDGEKTSFGSIVTANGGAGGGKTAWNGGNGGSGGGAGVVSNSGYGRGGSDGDNGQQGYPTDSGHAPGTGQGTTTREFGEATGKLYAGGGGGGRYMASSTPVVSMGGAGGGGAGAWAGSYSERKEATAGAANTGGGGGGTAGHYDTSRVYGGTGGSGIVCFRAAK